MKVTKKAIADYLGISRTAVSLVLNNSKNNTIADETREKIISAARELGYFDEINLSKKICFVLYKRKDNDPRYMLDLSNIETLCDQENYKLLFLSLQSRQEDFIKLNDYIKSQEIEGMIVAGDIDNLIIQAMDETKIPYVIYGGIDREDVNIVLQDAETIAYNAVSYLIKLGHKKIGLFSGAFNVMVHKKILNGYKRALEDNNIPFEGVMVQVNSEENGYELAQRMHVLNIECTAIFCVNTIIQFGALQYFREHKIAVPDKISLLGYGNSELVSISTPKLTTFSFDYNELARLTVKRLIYLINNECSDKEKILSSHTYMIEGDTVSFPKIIS